MTGNIAAHFNAWASLRLHFGTFNYQIVAVEGLSALGTTTIMVSG
jgi:hypothetical protein